MLNIIDDVPLQPSLCLPPVHGPPFSPAPQKFQDAAPPPPSPIPSLTQQLRCRPLRFLRCYALPDGLQVEKTQSAVKKEQGLASKLKEEINAVNSNAQQQMQLEKEKAEATAAEKALVEKTLDAERQKVRHCC